MKFLSMLIFFFFWHFMVYCFVVHWVWTVPGYLSRWGVRDFAGGYVIHIVAGLFFSCC
jgi:Amt family ammonium transporter